MRTLRRFALSIYGWLLARFLMRRAARFCPMCGSASTIPAAEWELIEATEEDVPCTSCFARPRLWMKARPR